MRNGDVEPELGKDLTADDSQEQGFGLAFSVSCATVVCLLYEIGTHDW